MKYEFKDVFNKHRNSPALIIGHGPSLNERIESLARYREKEIILFGCNEWFRTYSQVPNYVVYASNIDTLSAYKSVL
jgi:hypothetical protein